MDAGSLVRSLKSSDSHIRRLLQRGPGREAAVNDLGAVPVLGGTHRSLHGAVLASAKLPLKLATSSRLSWRALASTA